MSENAVRGTDSLSFNRETGYSFNGKLIDEYASEYFPELQKYMVLSKWEHTNSVSVSSYMSLPSLSEIKGNTYAYNIVKKEAT